MLFLYVTVLLWVMSLLWVALCWCVHLSCNALITIMTMTSTGPHDYCAGGKTVIAFAEDPTGYKWELIERPGVQQEPICQACGGGTTPAGTTPTF